MGTLISYHYQSFPRKTFGYVVVDRIDVMHRPILSHRRRGRAVRGQPAPYTRVLCVYYTALLLLRVGLSKDVTLPSNRSTFTSNRSTLPSTLSILFSTRFKTSIFWPCCAVFLLSKRCRNHITGPPINATIIGTYIALTRPPHFFWRQRPLIYQRQGQLEHHQC